jgi:formylglycine-generating enzyme required for sulfatase activity
MTKRRDNLASYEAYLQSFPKGRYEAAARAALAGLRVATAARPEVSAPQGTALNFTDAMALVQTGIAQTSTPQVASPRPTQQVSRPVEPKRKPGEVFTDCAACPEMVVMPSGRFLMGSPMSEVVRSVDEGPQRMVSVTAFAIGKYEVTQAQWQAVMGNNPSYYKSCDRTWFGALTGTGDTCPVDSVSWDDVQEFVRRLSERTGFMYRLPSEAEWEYAARAGTATSYPWGAEVGTGNANCRSCGTRWDSKSPSPAGKLPPNADGLYDMHGNVQEWVQDVWHESFAGAPTDGAPWISEVDQSRRVLRGGSWVDPAHHVRSASRAWAMPDYRGASTGFRLARDLPD